MDMLPLLQTAIMEILAVCKSGMQKWQLQIATFSRLSGMYGEFFTAMLYCRMTREQLVHLIKSFDIRLSLYETKEVLLF